MLLPVRETFVNKRLNVKLLINLLLDSPFYTWQTYYVLENCESVIGQKQLIFVIKSLIHYKPKIVV